MQAIPRPPLFSTLVLAVLCNVSPAQNAVEVEPTSIRVIMHFGHIESHGDSSPFRLPFNLGEGGFDTPYFETTIIDTILDLDVNDQQPTSFVASEADYLTTIQFMSVGWSEGVGLVVYGDNILDKYRNTSGHTHRGLSRFHIAITPHVVPDTDKIIVDIIHRSDTPAGLEFETASGTGDGSIPLPPTDSVQVLVRSGHGFQCFVGNVWTIGVVPLRLPFAR